MPATDFVFNVSMDLKDLERKFGKVEQLTRHTGRVIEDELSEKPAKAAKGGGIVGSVASVAFSPVTNALGNMGEAAQSMYNQSFGSMAETAASSAFGDFGGWAVNSVRKGSDTLTSAANAQNRTIDFARTLGSYGIHATPEDYAKLDAMAFEQEQSMRQEERAAQMGSKNQILQDAVGKSSSLVDEWMIGAGMIKTFLKSNLGSLFR